MLSIDGIDSKISRKLGHHFAREENGSLVETYQSISVCACMHSFIFPLLDQFSTHNHNLILHLRNSSSRDTMNSEDNVPEKRKLPEPTRLEEDESLTPRKKRRSGAWPSLSLVWQAVACNQSAIVSSPGDDDESECSVSIEDDPEDDHCQETDGSFTSLNINSIGTLFQLLLDGNAKQVVSALNVWQDMISATTEGADGDNDNRYTTLSTAGGCLAVIQAMRRFPKSGTVQKLGCTILVDQSSHSDDNKRGMVHIGGLPVLVSAMNRFPHDRDIQCYAWAVLQNLAVLTETRDALGDGEVQPIVAAMNAHREDEHLQDLCCTFFRHLAKENEQGKQLLLQNGGWFALAKCVDAHKGNAKLKGKAWTTMEMLFKEQDVKFDGIAESTS